MDHDRDKGQYRRNRTAVWLMASVLILWGCKDPENTDFQGSLIIKLVDAPAAIEALDIVFSRVAIHRAGASADLGWRIVSEDIVTQDIITLRNGRSINLVSTAVPEGSYDKIRVIFDISRLWQSGLESTVFIPLELTDGVVFEHSFKILEDKTTGITFDFDASRSVKLNNGRYELRPVVRIQNTDLAGSIAGAILPDTVSAIISTSVGSDSATTLSLAQSGNNSFELVDLPEGSYDVSIVPTGSTYQDTTITGVMVVRRQKTILGAIVLRPK